MFTSIAIAFSAATVLAWAGTAAVLRVLTRWRVLDRPGPRSSHVNPTPRGAGLAVVPVVAAGWIVSAWAAAPDGAPVVKAAALAVAALGLGALSFADDLRGLPVAVRLLCQGAVIGAMLALFPFAGGITGGALPPWAEAVATALAWLWFINLFNFMDGIDALAGVETASIGVGAAGVAVLAGLGFAPALMGAVAAGAACGFLIWNRPPARIFLGDVGSIPLGFLLGWLLLDLAQRGQWAAAAIVPLYYLSDATLTLGRRAIRGARVWQAHREHFYQRAVQLGAGHGQVSLAVLTCNTCLIGLALLAAGGALDGWRALQVALAVIFLLLLGLARWPRARRAKPYANPRR